MSVLAKETVEIWDSVKEELRNVVPASSFPWIMPLEPVGFENDTMTLLTGASFAAQIIRKHHYQDIVDAFKRITGRDIKFELIVDAKKFDELKKQTEKINKQTEKINNKYFDKETRERAMENLACMQSSANLNLKYKFENFVVGETSKMAHAVAFSVAQNPGQKFNPLFIYGGPGLGKTHLMQAIGHYAIFNHPKLKVRYIKTEEFTNELVNNLRSGVSASEKMTKFRQKFRNVDILLIDDIQFIESKSRTIEEVFNTFEALHNKGKQIVITSDRLPKDIPNLTDRLRTRFEMGIVVDLKPPKFETRVAILQKLAEQNMIDVPLDVCEYIANNFCDNVRELEGAFNKVTAFAGITGVVVTLEFAKDTLKCEENKKKIGVEDIAKVCAEYYNVTVKDLKSSQRNATISQARQVAVYLTRETTGMSYVNIAEFFEKKHPTMLFSYEKIKKDLVVNRTLREDLREIKLALKLEQ